jgi:hypothetical protein
MPGARPGISGRSTASFYLLRGSVEVGGEAAEELPVDVVEMVEETAGLYAVAAVLAAVA